MLDSCSSSYVSFGVIKMFWHVAKLTKSRDKDIKQNCVQTGNQKINHPLLTLCTSMMKTFSSLTTFLLTLGVVAALPLGDHFSKQSRINSTNASQNRDVATQLFSHGKKPITSGLQSKSFLLTNTSSLYGVESSDPRTLTPSTNV